MDFGLIRNGLAIVDLNGIGYKRTRLDVSVGDSHEVELIMVRIVYSAIEIDLDWTPVQNKGKSAEVSNRQNTE